MFSRILKLCNKLEGKQVGVLYHFTSPLKALGIADSGELRRGTRRYLSLTRDKNLSTVGVDNTVAFQLDGDKLSNKYSISPFADKGHTKDSKNFEAEERIETGVSDMRDYLLGITVWKERFLFMMTFSGQREGLIRYLDLRAERDSENIKEVLWEAFIYYLKHKSHPAKIIPVEILHDKKMAKTLKLDLFNI
jgi:hypothetical protein